MKVIHKSHRAFAGGGGVYINTSITYNITYQSLFVAMDCNRGGTRYPTVKEIAPSTKNPFQLISKCATKLANIA